jgi:hypothetical protein
MCRLIGLEPCPVTTEVCGFEPRHSRQLPQKISSSNSAACARSFSPQFCVESTDDYHLKWSFLPLSGECQGDSFLGGNGGAVRTEFGGKQLAAGRGRGDETGWLQSSLPNYRLLLGVGVLESILCRAKARTDHQRLFLSKPLCRVGVISRYETIRYYRKHRCDGCLDFCAVVPPLPPSKPNRDSHDDRGADSRVVYRQLDAGRFAGVASSAFKG